MGKIVAIGGYEYHGQKGAVLSTPIAIDKEIVELSGRKNPNFLFIPTASHDSVGYRSAIHILYTSLGCKTDELLLTTPKKEIKEKIQTADIIYVGGGNTLMMMKKWRKLGIDKLLIKAYKNEKILCGVSAGSMCWFKYGISDSLSTKKYIRVTGLGLIPHTNNPHYGSKKHDKGFRTKGMKEIMKRTKGICLAVPDACAIAFTDKGYRVLGKPKVSKAWWEKGKYHLEPIPPTGSIFALGQKLHS